VEERERRLGRCLLAHTLEGAVEFALGFVDGGAEFGQLRGGVVVELTAGEDASADVALQSGKIGQLRGQLAQVRECLPVARIAQAFQAKVLATAKTDSAEKARSVGATPASLEALLSESDIVTIHVPLNPQTRGLIGEKEISLMKPGALLINTARGPIVTQAALLNALEQGRLGGAGLDVYDEEPLSLDHPLRRFENAILLSHRGYATVEILRERFHLAMENILSFLDGKPTNLLNPEVLSSK